MNSATAVQAKYQGITADFAVDDYVISFSDVTVNLDRAIVIRDGKKLPFTAPEFELLTFFLPVSYTHLDVYKRQNDAVDARLHYRLVDLR